MVLALRLIFAVLSLIACTGSFRSLVNGPPDPGLNTSGKDNVFRFMAGIYLGTGIICLWMALTMTAQHELVYFMALTVFLAGIGRMVSFKINGGPGKYYTYMVGEIFLACLIALLQFLRKD